MYWFLLAPGHVIWRLPPRVHLAVSNILGTLWYYVVPVRRGVILENLRGAFPEESEQIFARYAEAFWGSFVEEPQ